MIHFPVTMIGCGGIGSITALVMGKLGCRQLTIIDNDQVKEHNIPSQLFRPEDIGLLKTQASAKIISELSDCMVKTIPERFMGQIEPGSVVISGLDEMKSRREIWEYLKFNTDVSLYIDGRIGGEIIEIFMVQPCDIDDVEFYEEWIFPDEEAAPLPCSARAIVYVGFIISGFIALQFKKWLKGEQYSQRFNFDLKTMTSIAW